VKNPYYRDEQVELWCGDFRDLLPEVIERHGVPDLCLVDPPYGETSLAWDRWPDGWPALMPGRSMWCFGSMRMFLDRRDDFAGWKLSQDVVWEKNSGSGFTTDRFKRVHEHALHWYRGEWSDVYHATPKVAAAGKNRGRAVLGRNKPPHTGKIASAGWEDDGTRIQGSVIYSPNMHGTAINETEKPSGLVENLLTYGCPPGGLVLDVFAGGCSTLVAARNSGRRAVGIELREEQCAKAVEWRLAQAVLPFEGAS
jgi:site-specific DNA-methyltransferase (adenine-specific)